MSLLISQESLQNKTKRAQTYKIIEGRMLSQKVLNID